MSSRTVDSTEEAFILKRHAIQNGQHRHEQLSKNVSDDLARTPDQLQQRQSRSKIKLLAQLPTLIHSSFRRSGLDDRKMLLEQIVTLLASLPVSSRISKALSHSLIRIISSDLPRPPATYIGKQYKYRTSDGSGNSVNDTKLGASGQPYSRNVTPTHVSPIELPDPGVVFDMLLAKKDIKHHPSGISSLLFNFANIIIHDIFSTTRSADAGSTVNGHSSYLDLQVVYGANEEEQSAVRSKVFGQLKQDAIGDWRIALMPPSTAALAILFSRNHNYIVKRISKRTKADDLISCKEMSSIKNSLTLPDLSTAWYVDPIEVIGNVDGLGKLARGNGNAVSAEFSVLYRWHAAVSQADEKWLTTFFESKWPGKRPDEVTSQQFMMAADKAKQSYKTVDPGRWNVHDWPRDERGRIDDALLADVLKQATCEVAAAFRARGHPSWFRPVEILGMITARQDWALCTINEFRAFLGLKTYSSFKEWNSDTDIAQAAEMLYGDIDNLELYPGLMAEESKPSMPGSGLCPGYTISRGILSDAAALTRGDRFYTTDYCTSNLTSYGYAYSVETQTGSRGMIGKLILATLPGQYTYNSIYALYPFRIPRRTIDMLKRKGILGQYDASYPAGARRWHAVASYKANKTFLQNAKLLRAVTAEFYDQDMMVSALQSIPSWREQIAAFYDSRTVHHLQDKAIQFGSSGDQKIVDLLDVVNTVSAEFTANLFALPTFAIRGLRPGVSVQELKSILAQPLAYHMYGSFDFLGRHIWDMKKESDNAMQRLKELLLQRLWTLKHPASPALAVVQKVSDLMGGPDNLAPSKLARHFYGHLFATGQSDDQLVENCLCMMASVTAPQSLVMYQILVWFLDKRNATHLARVRELAQNNDPASAMELQSYLLEAYRVSCQTPFAARYASQDVTILNSSGTQVRVHAGEGVYIPASAVHRDPERYEVPDRFQPCKERTVTLGKGDAPTQIILSIALPAMARHILCHRGLKSASNRFPPVVTDASPAPNERVPFFVTNKGAEHPLPINTSLHVLFEAK